MNKKSIDFFKIASLILLPISLIKRVDGHTTYLQVLYLLFGLYSFYNYKLWKNKAIYVVSAGFILNILSAYYIGHRFQIFEYGQLGLLISLVWLFKEDYTDLDFIKYAKVVTVISIALSLFYILFAKNIYGYRAYFGIPRVGGIVGEPNFSAFASLIPWIIFYKNKIRKWMLISLIPLMWTESRSIFIFFFVLFTLELASKVTPKLLVKLKLLFLIFLLSTPAILAISYEFAPNKTKTFLVKKFSTRFYLANYYSKLGVKHPLGVGLANGHSHYVKKGEAFRKQVERDIKDRRIEKNEQHSIFVQILSEFGIIIYVILSTFILFKVFPMLPAIPNSLLAGFSSLVFINGLNELSTFILIGYILNIAQQKNTFIKDIEQ